MGKSHTSTSLPKASAVARAWQRKIECRNQSQVILCDFFGMVKWAFQMLSDLQVGDQKVTLNHMVLVYLTVKSFPSFQCFNFLFPWCLLHNIKCRLVLPGIWSLKQKTKKQNDFEHSWPHNVFYLFLSPLQTVIFVGWVGYWTGFTTPSSMASAALFLEKSSTPTDQKHN